MTRDLGRLLIVLGGLLLLVGVALTFFGRLGLGRLPGDFVRLLVPHLDTLSALAERNDS